MVRDATQLVTLRPILAFSNLVTLLSGRCDGCGANLVLPSHNKAKVEAMEVPMVHTNVISTLANRLFVLLLC